MPATQAWNRVKVKIPTLTSKVTTLGWATWRYLFVKVHNRGLLGAGGELFDFGQALPGELYVFGLFGQAEKLLHMFGGCLVVLFLQQDHGKQVLQLGNLMSFVDSDAL